MEENLIGYLLNALDPSTQQEVEEYLHSSPEAQKHLALLRGALAPLNLDRDSITPPPGLASSTMAFIDSHLHESNHRPHSPRPPAVLTFPKTFWARVDLLVAAAAIFILVGIGFSWIYSLRSANNILQCQNNLHELYVGLVNHSMLHDGKFPSVNKVAPPPRNVAGMVIPKMVQDNLLKDKFVINCPGKKSDTGLLYTYKHALEIPQEEFNANAAQLTSCYGYNLGYRDNSGHLQDYKRTIDQIGSDFPMIADAPPSHISQLENSQINSPNHGGLGQNVLYGNGKVLFHGKRMLGSPENDIFLSDRKKQEAGMHIKDIVIGNSASMLAPGRYLQVKL